MADISDVEEGLCSEILGIIYPGGTAAASVTGSAIKIFRGWPTSTSLNADLLAGTSTVTVFSEKDTTRDTTRYPRIWRTISVLNPELTVSVAGTTVIVGGNPGAGQTIGVLANGVGYVYAVTSTDTLQSIVQQLATQIPAAVAEGVSLSVPGAATLQALVVGSSTAQMETRRQEQDISVSVWCPTPLSRDSLASAIDCQLSNTDWLTLQDGTAARLIYRRTNEIDHSERANLYRRDLLYKVEYPTTIQMTGTPMLFGAGTLSGAAPEVGFSCLIPPVPGARIPLGAIRFDAWYDPLNSIDQQCAAALSPQAFNYRLPFNATVDAGVASWPLATQSVMDFEISAAIGAGLSFWAFDSYQPDDTLSLALQLYLSSSLRSKLSFCMLGQSSNWGNGGQDQPSLLRDITMMTQAGYMTVMGNRPLYLVLDASSSQLSGLPPGGVATALALVRSRVQAAGGGNPYIVWLSGAALADYSNIGAAQAVGADAAGAYCTPRLNGNVEPASALFADAQADWAARIGSGFPMIPTAMTGWDQRPLVETPQPFYPIASGVTQQSYYDMPDNVDIGSHITTMTQAIRDNQSACPAQFGLIYAWNELAEGGWLVPTFTPAGPDAGRVAALGEAASEALAASSRPSLSLVN